MPKRLLLSEAQVAALAGIEPGEVACLHRAGKLPRWRLPGSREWFYEARDIVRLLDIPIQTVLGVFGEAGH